MLGWPSAEKQQQLTTKHTTRPTHLVQLSKLDEAREHMLEHLLGILAFGDSNHLSTLHKVVGQVLVPAPSLVNR